MRRAHNYKRRISDDGGHVSDTDSADDDQYDDHGCDHDQYSVNLVHLLSQDTNHRCQHEAKYIYNGLWTGGSKLALESPPPPPSDATDPDFQPRECCYRALRAEITNVETRTVPAEWWRQRARLHARPRERRHEAACHALAEAEGGVSVAWLALAQVSSKKFGARDAESPMFVARVLAARQERIAARAYDVETYGQDVEAGMLCFVRADVSQVVLGERFGGIWPDRELVDRALGLNAEHRRFSSPVIDDWPGLEARFAEEVGAAGGLPAQGAGLDVAQVGRIDGLADDFEYHKALVL